ncbi:MAG: serine/threonine protein kinase [Marmoricola sp.]|nr:serine/threonine protein kinase [Marmoricola sp.]
MPPTSMTPGTMLAGRYRLDDLLSEQDGARFWRATDTVLARSVAVHVVASSDPRAAPVLEAARRSAGVTEPHFLRVLDCADVDGLTWVINEWGEGVSLDVMLARGTLPPMRAAWLTREVAEAIAAAHARGEYHGRLNPEAVLVTEAGAVKIIGFVVNAVFERTTTPSPYGPIGPREADVVDLAGILYAALTGRWPGVAPSGLPPAPRVGSRPMRPRQVRAGVPRTLDAICDRVLNKEASEHSMPIETAFEVAAALSDYVGDPAAVAPVDLPSMHDEPAPPDPLPLDEPTDAAVALPGSEPAPAPVADPPSPPLVDPEATMASAAMLDEIAIEFLEPEEWTPAPPPPPFEQPQDRPLFADQERRVPAGSVLPPSVSAPTQPATPPPPAEPRPDRWMFEDHEDPAEPDYRTGRRWLRLALIIVLVLAIAAASYLAYTWGRDKTQSGGSAGTSGTSPPTATVTTPAPVLTGTPIPIVGVGDFDPEGNPPRENPHQVGRAIDGNPATAWHTMVYVGDPHLGGLKSGVGLVVDLGSDHTVSSVELKLIGSPTDLELYATAPGVNDPPVELADTQRVAGFTATGTSAAIPITPTIHTRYLLIWLTKLPAVPGGFQGAIAEITVRG